MATDDLRALYQPEILEHFRQPRNRGALPEATHQAEGFNPLCGDSVSLQLRVEGDLIRQVRFDGCGCALCLSSASMLTEAIAGHSVEHARQLTGAVEAMVARRGEPGPAALKLGRLAVFSGVAAFPSRAKCVRLAWQTLAAALDRTEERITTE